MPLKEEQKIIEKIEREYKKKGYTLEHARHIANAVVFGPTKVRHHFKHHKLKRKHHSEERHPFSMESKHFKI